MKEYHAVMEAIVVIKTILIIVQNIHILMNPDLNPWLVQAMNECHVVMDTIVVTKMILIIVQSIHILMNPDLNPWLV
jgi:hypothetical protein